MDYRKFTEKQKEFAERGSAALNQFVDHVSGGVVPEIARWIDSVTRNGFEAPSQPNPSQTVKQPTKESNAAMKKRKGMPGGGQAISVLGIIMGVLGVALTAGALIELLKAVSFFTVAGIVLALSVATVGGFFAVFGKLRRQKRIRFDNYLKLIGDKSAISIHALADTAGTSYKKTLNDLKEMIIRGILSPAWLDMKKYRLMLSEYSEEEQIPPEEDKNEGCLPRSARILRQIRADNDLIDDEEVSAKIDRIEDLTRKIFEIVDRYPEKEKQLYSFLNYYLPTTLKALENYARLEAQGIETESIRETKQKINQMLDELADGYEKQLDKLFEDDVLDISADIEVMRQMLQRDGLTEDEITKK